MRDRESGEPADGVPESLKSLQLAASSTFREGIGIERQHKGREKPILLLQDDGTLLN